ncbi:MAG: terminase family protein, partial [Pseudomonadota bacterium]
AAYKHLRNAGTPELTEEEYTAPGYERTRSTGEGKSVTDWIPEAKVKARNVVFPGGSRVTALSASPGAARGFGGNILLDEFAFHQDQRLIWAAAIPVAARGGHKVRVISTPNGKGNKFHQIMTDADSEFSRHIVDLPTAVAQGLDIDVEQMRRVVGDDEIFNQEFMLLFIEEGSAWLPFDLVVACEDPKAGIPLRYSNGLTYVGVDIATRNDLFVIWVMELEDGRLITREVIAERKLKFSEQDRLLDSVMTRYRVARVVMDQTGMGEKPVEDAKRRYGEERVQGIQFSVQSKLHLATGLKDTMQRRGALIPANDRLLRADLHAIKSVTGATGIRRLVANGETDGHADRFWALAMAVEAASVEYQPVLYIPVRPGLDQNGLITSGAIARPIKTTAGFGTKRGVWG